MEPDPSTYPKILRHMWMLPYKTFKKSPDSSIFLINYTNEFDSGVAELGAEGSQLRTQYLPKIAAFISFQRKKNF